MTKQELINALTELPGDARILVDVAPWDEELNLSTVTEVTQHSDIGSGSFAVLTVSTEGSKIATE